MGNPLGLPGHPLQPVVDEADDVVRGAARELLGVGPVAGGAARVEANGRVAVDPLAGTQFLGKEYGFYLALGSGAGK